MHAPILFYVLVCQLLYSHYKTENISSNQRAQAIFSITHSYFPFLINIILSLRLPSPAQQKTNIEKNDMNMQQSDDFQEQINKKSSNNCIRQVIIPKYQQNYNFIYKRGIQFIILTIYATNFFLSINCKDLITQQRLYVNFQLSCLLNFKLIKNDPLSSCFILNCIQNGTNCLTVSQSFDKIECTKSCCKNSQSSFNQNSKISLKLCLQQSKSNATPSFSDSGQYIFLAVACAIVVLIVITIICCCIKTNNQSNQTTTLNHDINTKKSSFSLKLSNKVMYDINRIGPEFIDLNDYCVICLDNKINIRTNCGHFYHAKCLIEWLKRKNTNPCPLCMGTEFNPVKIYCQKCLHGLKIAHIKLNNLNGFIYEYEYLKCDNCDKISLINKTQHKLDVKNRLKNKKFEETQVSIIQQIPKKDLNIAKDSKAICVVSHSNNR